MSSNRSQIAIAVHERSFEKYEHIYSSSESEEIPNECESDQNDISKITIANQVGHMNYLEDSIGKKSRLFSTPRIPSRGNELSKLNNNHDERKIKKKWMINKSLS